MGLFAEELRQLAAQIVTGHFLTDGVHALCPINPLALQERFQNTPAPFSIGDIVHPRIFLPNGSRVTGVASFLRTQNGEVRIKQKRRSRIDVCCANVGSGANQRGDTVQRGRGDAQRLQLAER